MAFSYNLSTSTGLVRLLITDTDVDAYILSDEEVQAFLSMSGDSVKRGAAMALETIATQEALVQKRIKLLDLQTDGPAVAKELRERATKLREEADNDEAFEDGSAPFDIAEMVVDQFTWRDAVQRL